MRGIGEHGVRQRRDALRGIVPGLMNEMSIARDGVDLAASFLELAVKRAEVLELGRAHEREVGGIEEEHAPMTDDVVLRNGLEVVVMERLDGEVRNFLVDHGHGLSLSRGSAVALMVVN